MNERIKELLVEAHRQTKGGIYNGHLSEWSEKFAELIVKECARALDDKLANPNGASVAYCDGSDLLEHFGVEE